MTRMDDLISLTVADLPLWLDARGSGIRIALPGSHAKFRSVGRPESGLVLRVREGPLPETDGWRSLYSASEMWELWLDDQGRYVFVAFTLSSPKRHVVVDAGFAAGDIVGEFADHTDAEQAVYPLQDLDILFFANWLAGYGDLILHASGVDLGGAGYCFAGDSGVGKSTLAAALASTSSGTVLGEDQVILRYREGRFWIYGTPWHVDPDFCSPRGVPLHTLFFLNRKTGAGVGPCGSLDGVTRLLQTAFVPYYRPAAVSAITDRLALLSEQVPFYTLDFRLGDDLLSLIRQT